MAEGFARAYGSDVITPASAGLTPLISVPEDTIRAMFEKHIDIRDQYPKSVRDLRNADFDLIVNMSNCSLTVPRGAEVRIWDVTDPYNLPFSRFRHVRDEIEQLVMRLILEIRERKTAENRPWYGRRS
jgi:protein-tyrosine-phosphatase